MNKWLVVFFALYCVVLWQAPKELPKDTLNVSVEGQTLQHYQRDRGECARTKIVMDALLRGLDRTDIKIKCIRVEVIPQQ